MNKWGVGLTLLLASTSVLAKDIQLLNVTYDPTRELYEQYGHYAKPEKLRRRTLELSGGMGLRLAPQQQRSGQGTRLREGPV